MTQRLIRPLVLAAAVVASSLSGLAQAGRPITTAFPKEEFVARRFKVAGAIGSDAVALVQAAATVHSSAMFRQSNEFFYLTGVGVPQAMLLIDGATKKSTLYLAKQDANRAAVEGALLTPDDPASVVATTGIDEVKPIDALQADLLARNKEGRRDVFVPFQPAEGSAESRDGATRRNTDAAADPWDGRISREANLRVLLMTRAGNYVTRNLSPILDEMRAIKSPPEIAVIDRATRIGGEAIMEAMRSTAPGVAEQELDALARFIYVRHGAQGEAYRAIVASGGNAWFAHHRASDKVMADGELVLMDYCPDLHYYRCDVTRQWPVNGTFSPVQRELYTFYLGVYEAILYSIKPHLTAQAILQDAVRKMDGMMATMKFSKPVYEKAAKEFVEGYRRRAQNTGGRGANLGHAVGMSTHDMGGGSGVMRPGLVFTIEPQFRIPEERIFLRLEDMIVITETEARIISDFVPRSIDGVEKLIKEEGLLQKYGKITRFDASQSTTSGTDLKPVVNGLHGLSLHDQCTGEYPPQPDTCLHEQLLERTVAVGGKHGVVHDVTLRIQGIFEPTTIEGGETPYAPHPYYKVGGTIRARDWSAWHIEVSNPKQTYWLNHYPKVSHTIYKEDFEATIPMAAGASVTVRVIDGNDRQIDNAEPGRPDRLQIIKGLSDTPLAGQMVHLEVLRVTPR